jgi:hypothetical protein
MHTYAYVHRGVLSCTLCVVCCWRRRDREAIFNRLIVNVCVNEARMGGIIWSDNCFDELDGVEYFLHL